MATLDDQLAQLQQDSAGSGDSVEWLGGKDAGWMRSMLAAIPSGLFKIAEGASTLGATLLDLGVDKDRAESVEQFFADINPFDEAANATAAGKITELIVNIGIPVGRAIKLSNSLVNAGIKAKNAGKYLPTRADKIRKFGQGTLAAGAAEGIFIGDVEETGTFGDWLGGPTEITRDADEPIDQILNRIKFGAEGALFTGALGAAAKTVGKLRNQSGTGRAIEGSFNKWIDKWISKPLRSRGGEDQFGFELRMGKEGALGKDTNIAENAMIEIDNFANKLAKQAKKTLGPKVAEERKKEILEKLNDVLMSGGSKRGTLMPQFGLVDEFAIDPKTGRAGTTQEFKTGNQLYNVTLDAMDPGKVKALRDELINTYKMKPDEVTAIFDTFVGMRGVWEKLFTSMGRRLTPEALEEFEIIIPKAVKNSLDRGYEVFKNNQGNLSAAKNYLPTKTILEEARVDFQKVAAQKGLSLSDDLADEMVDEVWRNAKLPKGILLSKTPGAVRIDSLPKFFRDSVGDEIVRASDRVDTNLADTLIPDANKEIIKKLLGKSKNPMSTLVEGTNALSAQVRFNEYLDNLVKKSNELKVKYDEWLAGGKVGPAPRAPFLVNSKGEARKYFGGTSNEWKKIKSLEEFGATPIGKFEDITQTLKPVDEIEAARLKELKLIRGITNPVAGKYALNDFANALLKTEDSTKSLPAQLYQNLILYPKATSQMAKTILAPFTHARNFISAAAFAGANGLVPFGNIDDVKKAWNSLQVGSGSFGTRKLNEFYQELLDLGVVNSQVQLGDLKRLLQDVDFGNTLNKLGPNFNGLNTFLKRMSKVKKFAQDAYTAEDDFWKIFTFLGEKTRMENGLKNAGLSLGDDIIEELPDGTRRKIGTFNDEYLKKASADLVKNNVPNYAFVSEFVKGLRKLPVGNFVAFPAEIIRTSSNIVDSALKEINFTVIGKQGVPIKPFASRGYQRLTGMAVTTGALPLGTVAAMQTIYDVSDDELDAMRRYVPEWSKNSVLVPFKDDEGNLEYIDFSHLNAYDTITRPIQTVINAVNQGRADEDGLIDDFVLGLIESTKELGQPFISESIWTEALQDVSPILGRGGRDSLGRQIWNPADSLGDKMYKGIAHLVEAQAPLNWKQLQRLGLSAMPTDSEGRFDKRGNEYELGNELMGIGGMRRVKVNPQKSFNYKITDYKKGIRNSRNLFTQATLKGGPINPEEVIDAYINANRALYNINREMYQDMQAAQTLGMTMDSMQNNMENRGENRAFNALSEGQFRPLKISKDVRELFEIKAQELGRLNPFDAAQDVMERIAEVLEATPLNGEFFPDLQNPFSQSLTELPQQIVNAVLPPPTQTGAFLGSQNVTLGNAGSAIPQNNLVKEKGKQVFGSTDRIFGT